MKCPKCNGIGKILTFNYDLEKHEVIECPKCHGSGKKPMTNEEWFCQLPTGEKAKFLREMVYYGCLYDEWEQQSITENVPTEFIIAKWLKEKHGESE